MVKCELAESTGPLGGAKVGCEELVDDAKDDDSAVLGSTPSVFRISDVVHSLSRAACFRNRRTARGDGLDGEDGFVFGIRAYGDAT